MENDITDPQVDDFTVPERFTKNRYKGANPIVSFGTRPSAASIIDYSSQQFVVLQNRTGGLVQPHQIELAMDVIDDVQLIQDKQLNSENHQLLKLRGIWFDDAYGSASLYVELLHDSSEAPMLSESQVQSLLHDGYGWYGHQNTVVTVKIRRASFHSDYFWPIVDEYYDWLDEESPISTDVVKAVMTRLSKQSAQTVYDHLRVTPVAPESQSETPEVAAATSQNRSGEVSVSGNVGSPIDTRKAANAFDESYIVLKQFRSERLRQASRTFDWALGLAVFGILIIFVGIMLVVRQVIDIGVVTTAGGVILEVVSALLFKLNKDSNDRLDVIGADLNTLAVARTGLDVIREISGTKNRDKALSELAEQLSGKSKTPAT